MCSEIIHLLYMLYTQPMNINGYVPFLKNTLDIIARGWKYAN